MNKFDFVTAESQEKFSSRTGGNHSRDEVGSRYARDELCDPRGDGQGVQVSRDGCIFMQGRTIRVAMNYKSMILVGRAWPFPRPNVFSGVYS